jgi:hypothetical protein
MERGKLPLQADLRPAALRSLVTGEAKFGNGRAIFVETPEAGIYNWSVGGAAASFAFHFAFFTYF